MFSRSRHAARAGLATAVALATTLGAAAPATADPTVVNGALDYEPRSAGEIVETVTANTVSLTFDPDGGPFDAAVSLLLGHDVTARGCRFDSTHEWMITGEFDPATSQFSGNYIETTEQTIGACESFNYARTFTPDEGRFIAGLDRATGIISSSVLPLEFELMVDPASLPSPAAPQPSDEITPDTQPETSPSTQPTTNPQPQTDPADQDPPPPTTDAGSDGGGDPPWPLIIVGVLAVGSLPFLIRWLRARESDASAGGLVVIVTDEEGDPVAGAEVTASREVRITNDEGTADFAGLAPGPHAVSVSTVGQGRAHYPAVIVTAGSTTTLPVTLSSSIDETIGVVSESPSSDAGPPGRTSDPTADELGRIPGPDAFRVLEPEQLPTVYVPPPELRGKNIDELSRSGGCEELMVAWQAAKRACDDCRRAAEDVDRQCDEAATRQEEAARALDGLPSEETRVELPDGTSLSQLDLDLRRRAAGAAWDAYMADPSPENAQAAENAWNEQTTPEWREEQRRSHREQVERLEQVADDAAAAKDDLGRRLADARAAEQDACADAAERKRRLDECLGQAAAAPETPAPPPAPPTDQTSPPAPEETPPSGPPPDETTPDQGPPDDDRRCAEGDERWRAYDGPHPFQVPGRDGRIDITVALIAGSRRTDRLGSLDTSSFPTLDNRGRAASMSPNTLVSLNQAEIRDAFSGERGLAATWETVGAGAVQQITVALTFRVRHVMATCERLERCVDGEWVEQPGRRTHLETREEQEQVAATVEGNIEAGKGRTEDDYMAEIIALFGRAQGRVKALQDGAEQLADYTKSCDEGAR